MTIPAETHLLAGRAAGLLATVAFVPYLVAVVRRRARPRIATWFIWTGVGGVLCASYFASGARATMWVAASYVLGPLVIALVALRYGEHGWTRFDKGCLAAALGSLGDVVQGASVLLRLHAPLDARLAALYRALPSRARIEIVDAGGRTSVECAPLTTWPTG